MPRIIASSSILGDVIEQTEIETAYRYGFVPVGGIIPWLKNLAGTPAIPTGWVECNGQVLSDAGSVYDGVTIPNLNGLDYFLRADATSGTTGGNSSHTHSFTVPNGSSGQIQGGNVSSDYYNPSGTTGGNSSNIPEFYAVVMILRVK